MLLSVCLSASVVTIVFRNTHYKTQQIKHQLNPMHLCTPLLVFDLPIEINLKMFHFKAGQFWMLCICFQIYKCRQLNRYCPKVVNYLNEGFIAFTNQNLFEHTVPCRFTDT